MKYCAPRTITEAAMNTVHLHLIFNHLPVILIPAGIVFYLLASTVGQKERNLVRASLWMLCVASLTALPAFLTGEPAEEFVEHLPGFSKALIEPHEDIGKIAFILSLVSGLLAGILAHYCPPRVTPISAKLEAFLKVAKPLFLLLAIVASGLLGYTAYLGGQIRHSEIRTGAATLLAPHDGGSAQTPNPSDDVDQEFDNLTQDHESK